MPNLYYYSSPDSVATGPVTRPMSANLFGWDLLYPAIKSQVKSNHDILVAFTHLTLVSNGFKCIGLGTSKILDGTETKSEALPEGWSDSCAIRYIFEGRLYHLQYTKLDDAVLINLIRVDERTTAVVQLDIGHVAATEGTLNTMFPNSGELVDLLKSDLIDRATKSQRSVDAGAQTDGGSRLQGTPGTRGYRVDPMGGIQDPPFCDPFPASAQRFPNVGEYDVNPLGRIPGLPMPLGPPAGIGGGGGMLFEPPRGGRYPSRPDMGLPPGAIPPGARFDPFRPPASGPRGGPRPNRPDNDEFPPPGYDDMFM